MCSLNQIKFLCKGTRCTFWNLRKNSVLHKCTCAINILSSFSSVCVCVCVADNEIQLPSFMDIKKFFYVYGIIKIQLSFSNLLLLFFKISWNGQILFIIYLLDWLTIYYSSFYFIIEFDHILIPSLLKARLKFIYYLFSFPYIKKYKKSVKMGNLSLSHENPVVSLLNHCHS